MRLFMLLLAVLPLVVLAYERNRQTYSDVIPGEQENGQISIYRHARQTEPGVKSKRTKTSSHLKYKGGNSEDENSDHEHDRRAFGSSVSFGRTESRLPTNIKNTKSTTFKSDCPGRPQQPNTRINCNQLSGCRLECLRGHEFPNGMTRLMVSCRDQEWQVDGGMWEKIPECIPICSPPCQNNGICIAPDKCNCSEMYHGSQCQFMKSPCYNMTPLPANSQRKCNSKTCKIMCIDGHRFPDGSSIANLICREGTWVPARPDWVSIPDCQAACTPPCQNGGICLSFNMCQCPGDFIGPQCQYTRNACDPKRLNFNGNYKCTGGKDSLTCVLSCHSGGHFQETVASSYTCEYATGEFVPAAIPQCIYEPWVIDMEWPDLPVLGRFNGTQFPITGYNTSFPSMPDVIPGRNAPGVCYSWSEDHYKTFDGRVISFQSNCSYTLVHDAVDNTFTINVEPRNGYKAIHVFAQDREYILMNSDKGIPVLRIGSRQLDIPTQLPGITAEYTMHFVELSFAMAGLVIKWDSENFISIEVTESLWNHTVGLCGRFDGKPTNDLQDKDGTISTQIIPFVRSWQVEGLGETCVVLPKDAHTCSAAGSLANGNEEAAAAFCGKLFSDARFAGCKIVLNIQPYYDACRWDYCACKEKDRKYCACRSISLFLRECSRLGIRSMSNWRDKDTCPMECEGGQVYMSCGPAIQQTCSSVTNTVTKKRKCEEGCYCPPGTVLHEQKCIASSQCPCFLRGRVFSNGSSVPKDCNTCTCNGGQWVCTQINCASRCGAIGDPHYETFDGRRFDFMGKCSYYLVKGSNYSIESENVPCSGAISESMSFTSTSEVPSCTKSVTIRLEDKVIRLKQNRAVAVNDVEVNTLPSVIAGAYIHVVSSLFLLVELPNGLVVWWDGMTRVYVDAPPSFHGQTQGLCGTFTLNQKDDFLTPEGDVEQSVTAFANKWKTDEKCEDEPEKPSDHPCDLNIHNKAAAQKYCSQLHGPLFASCHWLVDYEPYYQNCIYDMCSCKLKVGQCLCPIMAAYAKECARKGAVIDWRNTVRECGIHCPGGQEYQVCGNTCTRSCESIAYNSKCKRQCVEGCNCPEGQTLNAAGMCIPISQCTCTYKGMEFLPGHKEIRRSAKGPQLCTCSLADWSCRPASPEEEKNFPSADSVKTTCSAVKNEEFTTCEPPEPVTCKNMHSLLEVSTAICRAGCICKKGYVLEAHTKQCILPSDCPCHHGGRSYSENDTIQEECNTCTCESGKWKCTERVCTGVCTAWGDSHYKTFDGRIYDFHGTCDYVLTKGVLGPDTFDVTIQNVLCSSLGVSCSKSITLKVGSGDKQEMVTFTRDNALPVTSNMERIHVREAGLFVFAEVTDLGLVLQWDRGTRVYIKAEPKWKNRLTGLCGNYNDNMLDDFQSPSGGLSEVSAAVFGDSWRLQEYCPVSIEITDACTTHPNRKLWAMKKCGVLKSALFQPCHSEVQLDPFIERCIFDTCACDLGGDCECLCTAISAYAQECSLHGVHIKWRSQDLCPIQCDETCSKYSPCLSPCPVVTCDNHLKMKSLTQLCKEDTCIEGCELKACPLGQVYNTTTDHECVPITSCKTVCLQVGNKVYYEGDLMEEDACHTCYCSHHKKSCTGTPCVSSTEMSNTVRYTEEPATTEQNTAEVQCVSGWTPFMNYNPLPENKNISGDHEPLPKTIYLNGLPDGSPHCNISEMKDIECRTVNTHENAKETGLNAECSLEKGLVCLGDDCVDFEIRVLCFCGHEKMNITSSTTPPPQREQCSVERPNSPDPVDCHIFYQCQDMPSGPQLVKKTCGPHMMYNRDTQICDWPHNVISLWPECAGCKEGWSEWLNSTATDAGDYELLDQYEKTGGLPCERNMVHDIQCKFLKETSSGQQMVDYTESEDRVTCKHFLGLACNNGQQVDRSCEDYAIRVYCSCSEVTSYKPTSTTPETSTPELCPPGQIWSSCAVSCSQVCVFYGFLLGKTGHCEDQDGCIEGCVPSKYESGCPPGYLWRDENSCVKVADCTCHSHQGHPVKPGEIFDESECEKCQCISNQYVCDRTLCTTSTEATLATESKKPITNDSIRILATPAIISTVTPPPECDQRFIPLVQADPPLPDTAFSSSSNSLKTGYEPYRARLSNKREGGAWIPARQSPDEYIQIDLGDVKPVYGVIVQGEPLTDSHITSYKVLYSDGHSYLYVMDADNSPQIFRGPLDSKTSLKQIFYKPIEARYLRINPQTWENMIAVRVEVIGCGELEANTTIQEWETTTPTNIPPSLTAIAPTPVCRDEMGLDNGMMNDQQVTMSSFRNGNKAKFGPTQVHFSAERDDDSQKGGAWLPATNDVGQWIQFDFLEPQNLTGIVTKGQSKSDAWTKAFKVFYSHDGKVWNPLSNSDGTVKEFPANFDAETPQENYFDRVLQTQYLRLMPTKWHNDIAIRAEVIGCFRPYPEITTEQTTTLTPPPECHLCPTVPHEFLKSNSCYCREPLLWDGKQCINSTECPCYVKHIRYEVGTTYSNEDCESCTCKLNGIPECQKKECKSCSNGFRIEVTPSCACVCKPCPENTILCPTSNICINKTSWCDGIEDCPDDEVNCATTTSSTDTYTVTEPPKTHCPQIKCAPGYKHWKVKKNTEYSKVPVKTGNRYIIKNGTKYLLKPHPKPRKSSPEDTECETVICVPENVSKLNCDPSCPLNYKIQLIPKSGQRCPSYKCIPRDAICNVTDRTFQTFDGTEFKYDICDHVLVEDMEETNWIISMVKDCTYRNAKLPCSRNLVIVQDEHLLRLFPDLSVEIDGTLYMSNEIRRINGKNRAFTFLPIGDNLIFESVRYGFRIMWNQQSNVKITVSGKLFGKVDGLCGFFNGQPGDDKRKADGTVAKTSVEFGDSWSNGDIISCNNTTCPVHVQSEAYKMCLHVRKEPFSKCHSLVNLNHFLSLCTDTVCNCLQTDMSPDECRCQALLNLVTECMVSDSTIDLSGWRTQHNCLTDCKPPFVHHDCYHHECEPSCDGLQSPTVCNSIPGVCFSGCFCPDGLVRKGDKCIKPSECRDCICDGFGDPQYMTFDRTNYTFNGNCTYVASRDISPSGNHKYQVLVTNKQCPDEPASTCTEALIVEYDGHTVVVRRNDMELQTLLDGIPVTKFPHLESWLRLEKNPGYHVTILIPPLQLEATYYYYNYAFVLRLPSHTLGAHIEGLCGNCNRIPTDDLQTPSGTKTTDVDEFGLSWLVPNNSSEEACVVPPKEEGCIPLPPNEDPCIQVITSNIFQKCNIIVDPAPFIRACQFDLCHSLNQEEAVCRDVEAYARECEHVGLCVDWRSKDLCPYKCPDGLEYQACQTGCMNTCEDYKDDPSDCPLSTKDGCFCPGNQVLRGNMCVNTSQCEACDTEGHYQGDTWQQDHCTNCTCFGNTKLCQHVKCPDVSTVCKYGMVPMEVPDSGDDCCKKVACVPTPTPEPGTKCPELKLRTCPPDQIPTQVNDSNNCPEIACICRPCNETDTGEVDNEPELPSLKPGMELVYDTSGCCPQYKWICDNKGCPPPRNCTPPFIAVADPPSDSCCPTYHCEPPPDECVFQLTNSSENVSKKVGSIWKESPCTTCECVQNYGSIPVKQCNSIVCPSADVDTDLTNDYVVESVIPPGECCSHVKLKACKVGEKVLKPGGEWRVRHPDRCEEYVCQETDGNVKKKTAIEICTTTCELGSEYVQPEPQSPKCCGHCKHVGCVVDGEVYPEGDKWRSEDNCTEYFCFLGNDTLQVGAVTAKCPEIPTDIQKDYMVKLQAVPGQCCKKPYYVSCIEEGVVYQPGETWASSTDPCRNITCLQTSQGDLTKSETVQTCTETCAKGWEYVHPKPGFCCGLCKQVACTYEGKIYEINAKWTSPDGCTDYSCERSSLGQYQVIKMNQQCPSLTHCAPENIYKDGCCNRCKIEAGSKQADCRLVNVTHTKELVQNNKNGHGLCVNYEPLEDFAVCEGHCMSSTSYNRDTNRHDSNCQCCQVSAHKYISVNMQCKDGHEYTTKVPVPTACSCTSCGLMPTKS